MQTALVMVLAATIASGSFPGQPIKGSGPTSSKAVLTIPIAGGKETFTYDANIVPTDAMRRWGRLSPDGSSVNYIAPYTLESCLEGDARYRPCSSDAERMKNLSFNGHINLKKNQQVLSGLDSKDYPIELLPVIDFLRENLLFHIWREELRLRYLETGDAAVLATDFKGIDPRSGCSRELDKIREERDPARRYQAVTYEWSNCVNSLVRSRLGEYPTDDWKKFLVTYKISDEVEYDE